MHPNGSPRFYWKRRIETALLAIADEGAAIGAQASEMSAYPPDSFPTSAP
jgi:hypothetical protein